MTANSARRAVTEGANTRTLERLVASRHGARVARAAALLMGALIPAPAWAHIKYFEDDRSYPLRTDLIVSERTGLLLAAALSALLGLVMLQRLVGGRDWPHIPGLTRMGIGAPTLLAVQAGIGLVYAATSLAFVAPNLALPPNEIGLTLAGIQLVIAFSFITGVGDWIAALTLLLLPLAGLLLYSPAAVLEQLHWVGIGTIVLVVGRCASAAGTARTWFERRDRRWYARAVTALRVLTGVAITAAALDEKIWNPDLGRVFLTHHPQFNFVATYLGVSWFNDDLFVLAAGIAEGTIGILLASGLLPRLVILGMWLPFNLGIPFLPPQELLGHLPIFGIMYLILVSPAARAATVTGAPVLRAPEKPLEPALVAKPAYAH